MNPDNETINLSQFDICSCAGFRKDHKGGRGIYRLLNTLVHGLKSCEKFRLVNKAEDTPQYCEEERESNVQLPKPLSLHSGLATESACQNVWSWQS